MPWPIHRWVLFYCVLIIVLKDCRSLFLRHVQSGRCIKTGGYVYKKSWAEPTYAVMTDNCLDVKAQFRYLNSGLLQNIGTGGTFFAVVGYSGHLSVYKGLNIAGIRAQNNKKNSLKQTADGTLSFHNVGACPEPLKSSTPELYVERETSCVGKPEQNFTFGAVTQYSSSMNYVSCSPKQRMMIQKADYGDFKVGDKLNISASTDKKCSILTKCQVKSLCGGNRSCDLTMDNNLLPSQYCSDTSKEIYTQYTCVDDYTSNAITEFNVRLSQSPNKGFIEVKDGSTWRKINEERWDENRQKMLCQHLRFNETDENSIDMKNIGRGNEIATGDLICYGAQPSGTSCCIHLEPSISTSSTTVPYVTCGKICDEPLLQNLTSSVFSGSGGPVDYEKVKFYNDGWCATGPGAKHLSIDLQNEYHITRVVTMGDRNQTDWSESFTLTYNHNESLVDQNRVQITGNKNGYQASIRTIDIYNVRHIKIESTTNKDFCLRIELCGEVQSPASVQTVKVKSSNFSVHLSWTIPEAKVSSYLTHFIIYLNGTEMHKIPRAKYGNQFILRRLRPNTEYNVGIQAQDGSLKKTTIVYQSFKTEEAVPSGPPLNVNINSRSIDSLGISWKAPDKNLWNGKLTGYQVCYSSSVIGEDQECSHTESSVLSYNIPQLQPSTKYFVTVAASTKIGYGNKSSEISKITNGGSVNPIVISHSSLSLNITQQAKYITGVMVIVQIASSNPASSEDIETNELLPHSENKNGPYITAYLKANVLPLTFVIGDGKEYNYEKEKYSNEPLGQNTSYIVFLRFFESKDSFYSTKWSNSVRTMAKPPAPKDLKILSTGPKKYTISWSQPPLPDKQTVLKYYITYELPNGSRINSNISNNTTSFDIGVEFDKKYMFEIQVETQAGKSDPTSKLWYSHAAPSTSPEKTKAGYKVILKKPKAGKNIRTVALIMLQQSSSSNPPPPENLVVNKSPPINKEANNLAFVAKEFQIDAFKDGDIEVLLRGTTNNKRRERRAIVVNVALIANATYIIIQRNEAKSKEYFWSYWSDPFNFIVTTPRTSTSPTGTGERGGVGGNDGGSGVGAAVGASIAVIVIIVALVVSVIYFKRRRALQRNADKESVNDFDEMKGIENNGNDGQDRPANDDIYSNETGHVDETEHPAVPVAEFAHYVNEMKANENYEFQSEYDDLPANMYSWEVAKIPFNKQKNRYGNIVTYDHSRVVLSGDENEDYINASYMDGVKENSYIASQGPTKLTLDDMWRMVWEQRTYSIVMVTSLVELGKPKCKKYWPDKGTENYGDIEVTLMKTEEFAYHVTHTLQLKKDGEEREVRHYYFQSWPDHGVPKYPTQLLAFRRHFRTHHLKQSGPIVVHCSAGVGRTGVFLAIDTILDKLEKGLVDSIDVFGQVCAMRERRMNMVQTLGQYIFIHEAILETILCGMNEVDSSRIQKEVKNLAQDKASGMTGFQERFKRLGEVSPKLSDEECIAGLLEENVNKNRNKNVYPAECSRVPLQYINGVENSDYINAVFVHGYLGRNYFIATQSPLPNTINDFWRLVNSQKSSTVVLLNNVKEGTSFPRFWPTDRGQPTQYGNVTVQLDSESESDGIWTRKFIVSPYPDLSDGQVVSIFHYTKWADHRVPANGNGVITLTSLVEKSRQSHGEGPVIVACSDGAGRTGTYIAISNLLERMKIEQAMDVFQSIKIIRGIRPQFVENAEQYQFCYTAISQYLDAFSEYANFE